MIAVVILGILASVAVVGFIRYVRRSSTVEALSSIAALRQAEITYRNSASENYGVVLFVSATAMPAAAPGPTKYPVNPNVWIVDPGWFALGFVMTERHYYQYQAIGGAGFTVRAFGDLDGDGIRSTFSNTGSMVLGEPQFGILDITNELE